MRNVRNHIYGREVDVDYIINQLRKEFEEMIVDGFIRDDRKELLSGFLHTEKMRYFDAAGKLRLIKINNDGRISIRRQFTGDLRNRDKDDLFMHREADGSVIYMISDYSPLSRKIEAYYNKKVAGKNIEPNTKWKEHIKDYVNLDYINKVYEQEEFVLENGDAWECLAFASRVPCNNVKLFEDLIIACKKPSLLFAFASEVEGADIEKLRNAMVEIGTKEDIFRFDSYYAQEEEPSNY